MFDIKKITALFFGKLTRLLLSFFDSGATAAPGLVALTIDPNLLKKLKSNLNYSIIVSGTNGKTTTARLISTIFKKGKIPFYHNRAGSNLLRGIASELINQGNLLGHLKPKIGLWEVDEAVLPLAIEQLQPKYIIINNLFRDQLDRYGEIDTLASVWLKALKKLDKNTLVFINADDPTVTSLGRQIPCSVLYFGINDRALGKNLPSHASDATLCPHCTNPLSYQDCFFSHLGNYQCPKCGVIQPKKDYFISQAWILANSIQLMIKDNHSSFPLNINLGGLYNLYNILAAFILTKTINIPIKRIKQGFLSFKPAFGRFEKILFKNKKLSILLVKNPTGFNEILKIIKTLTNKEKTVVLLALNDCIADGRDVSWIWDVDFSVLKEAKIHKLIISGKRAHDLALRLKYEEIKTQQLIIPNLTKATTKLLNSSCTNLIIMPTYTAMLKIREILNKKGLVHKSWKD